MKCKVHHPTHSFHTSTNLPAEGGASDAAHPDWERDKAIWWAATFLGEPVRMLTSDFETLFEAHIGV
jgi:hypothetical protein